MFADTWSSVPTVISSGRASPAAKRLALRLTFAVYIMGPQFTDSDPWCGGCVGRCTLCPTPILIFDASFSASDMLEIMHSCITHIPYAIPLEALSPNDELQKQERIGYAMIISLFAVRHSTCLIASDI
jgi:hypothetical protein